jgi:hypothetical protein
MDLGIIINVPSHQKKIIKERDVIEANFRDSRVCICLSISYIIIVETSFNTKYLYMIKVYPRIVHL